MTCFFIEPSSPHQLQAWAVPMAESGEKFGYAPFRLRILASQHCACATRRALSPWSSRRRAAPNTRVDEAIVRRAPGRPAGVQPACDAPARGGFGRHGNARGARAAHGSRRGAGRLPGGGDHLDGTSSAVGGVRGEIMLHYAVVFFVIAIIAAVFGFGGIASGAAGIAKVLFVVFLVVAGVSLLLGRRASI